jgi:hypothetical protein
MGDTHLFDWTAALSISWTGHTVEREKTITTILKDEMGWRYLLFGLVPSFDLSRSLGYGRAWIAISIACLEMI